MTPQGEDKGRLIKQIASYSTLGLEMGLSVVVGVAIGYYLDKWLKTEPWFLIIFHLSRGCRRLPEPLSGHETLGTREQRGLMAKEIKLASIERTQWVILALFTLGSLAFWDWRITLGVIIGGIICILNFKALRMIFEGGFSQGKIAGSIFVKYAIKFLALLAAVAGVVFLLQRYDQSDSLPGGAAYRLSGHRGRGDQGIPI